MLLRCALIIALLCTFSTNRLQAQSTTAPEGAPAEVLQVVEHFIAAFNARDLARMLSLTTPDVQWLSIEGEKMSVEAAGVEALRSSLESYFRSVPTARSTIERSLIAGPHVSIWERVRWQGRSGERTQASLAIYELQDGRIRRVWYYPAQP